MRPPFEARLESGRHSPPALRSRLALVAGLVLLAATWTGSAAPSPTTAVVRPHQKLTILRTSHEAFARPDPRSTSLGLVPVRRPITDGPTVLHVLGQRIGGGQLQWIRVRLPGRPNGHTGWIRGRGTRAATTPWHIVVSTSARRVRVYRAGRVVRVFKAIVGKPSTPTPLGTSFVEESIAMPGGAVGGPFALALGSRSTVLQQFAGGPGQIALHGLWNVGGTLGTAASNGCVRLDTAAMRWLAARIGPGVPVTVTR